MSVDDAFDALVGLVYEAALDTEQWSLVLRGIGDLVDAGSGMLAIGSWRRPEDGLTVPLTLEVDPELQQRWLESYVSQDIWWLRFSERFDEGVLTGAQCVDVGELRKSAIYNEVLARAGVEDGLFAALARTSRSDAVAALYRGPGRERFGSREVSLLSRLLPHLQRAARIHDRLYALTDARDATATVSERLPYGLFWLDGDGRVLGTNPCAERILSRGDGVQIRGGRPEATVRADQPDLARAIGAALAIAAGRSGDVGEFLRIRRMPVAPAYPALVVPVAPRSSRLDFGSRPRATAAVLILSDPEAPAGVAGEAIRKLFGLTPTLARLATAIASGRTLTEYAADAGVTIGTARQYMKDLLGRMGVRRQADAVRLIVTSVARIETGSSEERTAP